MWAKWHMSDAKLFYTQSRTAAQLKSLFELRTLLYRCEFTFSLTWGLFISLLVWKGFFICQKYNFFNLKKIKQAQPRWEKVMQK